MKILIYLTSLYKDLLIQYSEFSIDQRHDVFYFAMITYKKLCKKKTRPNKCSNILDLEKEIAKEINTISSNLKKSYTYI